MMPREDAIFMGAVVSSSSSSSESWSMVVSYCRIRYLRAVTAVKRIRSWSYKEMKDEYKERR
jgi:hypothetical protein